MREAVPFSHVFPINSYVLYRPPDNSRHKIQMPKAGPHIVLTLWETSTPFKTFLHTRSWILMPQTCPNSDMILLRVSIIQRWQPAMQENSSSTRSSTTQATCVAGPRRHSVCVGRVTPPTTTHGNPLRRFVKHRHSWTIAEKISYLLWSQSVSKRNKFQYYPARFNTSTPYQEHKQDTGISCKILSYFLEGVETHLGFWRV